MSILHVRADDDRVKPLDAEQPVPGADAQGSRIDLLCLLIHGLGQGKLVPFGQAMNLLRVLVPAGRALPSAFRGAGRHDLTGTSRCRAG